MTVAEVLNEIKRGQLRPVYLIHGQEGYFREELCRTLRQAVVPAETDSFNYTVVEPGPEQLPTALSIARTIPFFADRRLVMCKDVPWFASRRRKADGDQTEAQDEDDAAEGMPASDDAALLRYLENPAPFTVFVMVTGEGVDSKKKVSRAAKASGAIVDCAPLKVPEAVKWVMERARTMDKKLGLDAAQALIERTGPDLRLVVSELDKLAAYCGDKAMITREDVQAVVGPSTETSIFRLMDALGQKNKKRALNLLDEMLRQGEPALVILYMIARQIRLILGAKKLAEKGYGPSEVAVQLKTKAYAAETALGQARRFSEQELVEAFERLLEADLAIKSGADPRLALELLLVGITR